MQKSIEEVLTELDYRLEQERDGSIDSIINYIELIPEGRSSFISYLITNYNENSGKTDKTYQKMAKKSTSYSLIGAAAGFITLVYALKTNLPLVDTVSILLPTYSASYIATRIASRRRVEYFNELVKKELRDGNLKEKIRNFYIDSQKIESE